MEFACNVLEVASDGVVVIKIDQGYVDAVVPFLGAFQSDSKKLRMTAVKFIARKSSNQLRLAHLLFDEIARATGNDPEDVKHAIKDMVLPKKSMTIMEEGVEYTDWITKSLRDCDRAELASVIEKALSVAAEYGIDTLSYQRTYEQE